MNRCFAKSIVIVTMAMCFVRIAQASNFRAADQVFLPSAIHIASPWAVYASDVWITNESDDAVSISCLYVPANGSPVPIEKRDIVKLAPRQHLELPDFLGKTLGIASGLGQVIFNGCLDGADCNYCRDSLGNGVCGGGCGGPGQPACTWQDSAPPESFTKNYRNISVESRIYSYAPATGLTGCQGGCPPGPSVGQDLPSLPWWSYGDAKHPMMIAGLRVSTQFRTNIGMVNASDASPVTLTVTLFDGTSHQQRDQATVTLGPLESRLQTATALFPALGEWSRLNRTRAATNAYVTVSSSGADDAFFAFGSLIDASTNDATTLEGVFETPLSNSAISVMFGQPVAGADGTLVASRFVAASKAMATPSPQPALMRSLWEEGYRNDLQFEAQRRRNAALREVLAEKRLRELDHELVMTSAKRYAAER